MNTLTAVPRTRLFSLAKMIPSARAPWFDRLVIALAVILLLVACLGEFMAPYDPYSVQPALALKPPSQTHWLGTDENGRDILSRILAGARSTVFSAVFIGVAAAAIGVALAALASTLGRWIDELIMRICDIMLAIPPLVLALGIAMALGPSLQSATIALIASLWPGTARIVRGVMRKTMSESYVEAARSLGASRLRVMVRHVIPNSMDVAIVHTAFEIGGITLILAGLSFVGVGAQPPSAEWGAMAAAGRNYALTAWWVTVAPGLAITFAVVTLGLFGEVLQGRLSPSRRKKS
ncbi:MAG: ABC transporter permease [Arthrobacter sp.]|nr:ABC transporter permease [Arthrobacter sp.]